MLSELSLIHSRPRKNKPRAIEFELCVAPPDSICPITQDAIAESALEFLRDATFVSDKPELRCMKLQCGHEFSAMNLIYHWARSRSVKCPVCRGGPDHAHLDLKSLPEHFRGTIVHRAQSERRRDANERRRENMEAVRRLSRESYTTDSIVSMHNFVTNFASIAVVRRFAILGQHNLNTGLRFNCDCLTTDEDLIFTSTIHSAWLTTLGEFKMFGILKHQDIETRFPETGWCEFGSSSVVMMDDSMTCQYRMDVEGDWVKLTWQVRREFFGFMTEHHLYLMGL